VAGRAALAGGLGAMTCETESGCSVVQTSQQRCKIGFSAKVQTGHVQNFAGVRVFSAVGFEGFAAVEGFAGRLDGGGWTRRLECMRFVRGAVEDLVGLGDRTSDLTASLFTTGLEAFTSLVELAEPDCLERMSEGGPKVCSCMPRPRRCWTGEFDLGSGFGHVSGSGDGSGALTAVAGRPILPLLPPPAIVGGT